MTPEFQLIRRGYDPVQVADFAKTATAEIARLREDLERANDRTADAEARANSKVDEAAVAQFLGEESSQLLFAARKTANELVARAEANAADLRDTAEREVRELRAQVAAEVAAERARSQAESAALHEETMNHRRNVLKDLTARRDLACRQINELIRGRDVLVDALNHVSATTNGLVSNISEIAVDPASFVNLDPQIEGPGTVYDDNAGLSVTRLTRSEPGRRATAAAPREVSDSSPLRIHDNDTMAEIDGTSLVSSTDNR